MRIEWNANKNRANQKKHGISFELAQDVFGDPLALSRPDRIEGGEERWHTLGVVEGVILIVANTFSGRGDEEVIRIISARKATKHEQRFYEEGQA